MFDMKVQVPIADVIAKIEQHRAERVEEFRKAVKQWRKKLVAEAQKIIDGVGDLKDFPKGLRQLLDPPWLNVSELDEAAGMLRMSTEGVVEVGQDDFKKLILGERATPYRGA